MKSVSEQVNKDEIDDKIMKILQFAKKANKLIFGHDVIVKHIKKNKPVLIITAIDLSSNSFLSIDKYIKNADNVKICQICWGTKDLFSQLSGKLTGIIGVIDENFKSGLLKHFSLIELEE